MKILLFGHKGWIGGQIFELLKNTEHDIILSDDIRADNVDDVTELLNKHSPTHVMMFTGRTHGTYNGIEYGTIDYLEQDGMLIENINDNLYAHIVMAKLCNDRDIHMTYIGTGCIFTYDDEHRYEEEIHGFTELNKPNFFGSSYSIVKGFNS